MAVNRKDLASKIDKNFYADRVSGKTSGRSSEKVRLGQGAYT